MDGVLCHKLVYSGNDKSNVCIGLVSFGNFDGSQPGYNLELFPFFLSLGVVGI